MNMIKKYSKYVILFIFFFTWNVFLQNIHNDEIWNYGFAHNIYLGKIPYLDFNMVLTPLYPFLMSIIFHLFGSNILIFHIEHTLILVLIAFFLFKLIDKKAWLVLVFLVFPVNVSFPSYNVFVFLLFFILVYLEEKKRNDYLIGIFLALAFLTKQSVGACMVLASLYYIKDLKKILKRFLGFMLPTTIFIIYLLITKSFMAFFDLCVMGLFDFTSSNGRITFFFYFTIILILLTIYSIIKKDNHIIKYYCLAFFSMNIPMFDLNHSQWCVAVFLFMCCYFNKEKEFIKEKAFFAGVLTLYVITYLFKIRLTTGTTFIYPNNINKFEYRLINDYSIEITEKVNKFIQENKDKKIIILDVNAYYFKLVNDMDITYLDLINGGNWGYNGSDKILEEIKKNKDAIFIVSREEMYNHQTDKRALKYVMENGKLIEKVSVYDVYIFETTKTN